MPIWLPIPYMNSNSMRSMRSSYNVFILISLNNIFLNSESADPFKPAVYLWTDGYYSCKKTSKSRSYPRKTDPDEDDQFPVMGITYWGRTLDQIVTNFCLLNKAHVVIASSHQVLYCLSLLRKLCRYLYCDSAGKNVWHTKSLVWAMYSIFIHTYIHGISANSKCIGYIIPHKI